MQVGLKSSLRWNFPFQKNLTGIANQWWLISWGMPTLLPNFIQKSQEIPSSLRRVVWFCCPKDRGRVTRRRTDWEFKHPNLAEIWIGCLKAQPLLCSFNILSYYINLSIYGLLRSFGGYKGCIPRRNSPGQIILNLLLRYALCLCITIQR